MHTCAYSIITLQYNITEEQSYNIEGSPLKKSRFENNLSIIDYKSGSKLTKVFCTDNMYI